MELSENGQAFIDACAEARKAALSFSDPLIVHHYDADGLSSGAIVEAAFRAGFRKHRRRCVKRLDDAMVEELRNEKEVIFVDLGGGSPRVNELQDVLIIDHHQTSGVEKHQVNPLLYGIDGGDELSSSGTAALVFGSHYDLGVVGAVGDMQYPLVGMNRHMMKLGVDAGEVEVREELRMFGRYSRPLANFLAYSDDPYVPGISYSEENAQKFFDDIGIELREGNGWKTYSSLSEAEKKRLVSALAGLVVDRGMPWAAEKLVGEVYLMKKRMSASETYDASEFSTLLNACGRHGRPEVGVAVCLGEKGAEAEASRLLTYHKTKIREGIMFARSSLVDFGPFMFLDARGVIADSIIGIVCGMAGGSARKPVIGIAESESGIKVSSRGTREAVDAGLNLGEVMHAGVAKVGGVGGGHRIAAGANIPSEGLNGFLAEISQKIRQMP